MRSVAAYTFSEAYRELDAYLKIANYTDAKDYMVGPSHYDEDLAGLIALRTLVDFRARDERLWCARVGPVRDEDFSTMVAKLALILDSETISSFKSELASLVGGYAAESQRLGEVLYNSDLGVPRPEDDK